MKPDAIIDCLIVGGGPAGLTAATYLGRYRRSVMVVDEGESRAALIPESHNYPGYTGISGPDLLKLLRRQAARYGAQLIDGRVDALEPEADQLIVARFGGETVLARSVLLATGIIDKDPPLSGIGIAVKKGTLRYCPICDGYEARDQRIGVFGSVQTGGKKALFLRTYSPSVTLLLTQAPAADDEDMLNTLSESGVAVSSALRFDLKEQGEKIAALFADGTRHEFDVMYPALGCEVRSDLAMALGAKSDETGALIVDAHQQTGIPGLLAAGDVVSDLHQLSVAVGHAAIASTAIHNGLPRNFRSA
jgi:thioredoxin reductase (NADPH)